MGVLVLGCGGGSSAGKDAPSGAPTLEVSDSTGTSTASVAAPDTLVGQSSSIQLRVTNHGTAETGVLAVSIEGAAANDFLLDNALTTCAAHSLAVSESCDIAMSFRPLDAGDRVATLTIASAASTINIALAGKGIMPNLHFNPTSIAFGQVEIGSTAAQTTIEVRNDGALPTPIDAISVTGASFTRGVSTCGATLEPNTSCDIVLLASPATLGANTGNVTITSGPDNVSAPLSVSGARRVTIIRDGTGTGTVTSSPPGIDCGTTSCSALFEDAVMLTAVPGANAEITSWSVAGCGQSTTCVVPADATPVTVSISFTLAGSSSVSLVFTGNASGEVYVVKEGAGLIATCFASCDVPAEPGDMLIFRASTPSTFGGYSGACTTTEAACYMSVPTGSSTVNVAMNKDPKEQWTRLLPATRVHAVAYDGANELIVATETNLFKLSTTGSTVWNLPLAVCGVATGPSNTIYVVTATDVKKLDATGSQLWTRPHMAGGCPTLEGFHHNIAVASDGAVAIRGTTAIARLDTNGTTSWTRMLAAHQHQHSVAIGANGTVMANVDGDIEKTEVRVFATDNTELTTLGPFPQYHAMITSDAAGGLIRTQSGHSDVYLGAPNLNAVLPGSADYVHAGATAAGSDVGWAMWTTNDSPLVAWAVRRYASGSPVWLLSRPVLYCEGAPVECGTQPYAIDGAPNGRIALAGYYIGMDAKSTAWVQVYDP